MAHYARLLVVAGILFTGVARADFIVTSTRGGPNPWVDSRFDIVEFFAKNTGANGSGTKVLASDINMSNDSGGRLVFGFVGASATAGADLVGVALPQGTSGVFIPSHTFVNFLTNDGTDDPTAAAIIFSKPDWHQHNVYAAEPSQFEVTIVSLSGGVNASTSNNGRGAMIAVAVLPKGDVVSISGSIGGDTGPAFPITATNLPEPASVAFLMLVSGTSTRRRRHGIARAAAYTRRLEPRSLGRIR